MAKRRKQQAASSKNAKAGILEANILYLLSPA
jgi:hypothetical protein